MDKSALSIGHVQSKTPFYSFHEGHWEDQFWFVSRCNAMEPVRLALNTLQTQSLKGQVELGVLLIGADTAAKIGLARMIYKSSRRAQKSWVSIYCGDVSESELEMKLFGRGSEPGYLELADGGTIYFHQVDLLSVNFQKKLVEVFRARKISSFERERETHFDVRIIGSSSIGFESPLAQFLGQQFTIEVPPLEKRKEEIMKIAEVFSQRVFQFFGKTFSGFSEGFKNWCQTYDWPGNIGELWSVLFRVAATQEESAPISLKDIHLETAPSSKMESHEKMHHLIQEARSSAPEGYMTFKKKWVSEFEKEYLISALERHHGNVSAASREARMDRSNFLRLLRRYDIRAQSFRKAA